MIQVVTALYASVHRLAERFAIWHLATGMTTVATRSCQAGGGCTGPQNDPHERRRLEGARLAMLRSPAALVIQTIQMAPPALAGPQERG
ncbi:MAG: hypothetical protein K0S99_1146 [Thermomicrobiales bacterium]|nr:hypothetical protein [Thermomicrobiales bacterium]